MLEFRSTNGIFHSTFDPSGVGRIIGHGGP